MTAIEQPITEQQWFQTCPIGIMALNGEGRICGINKALEKLIGLPAGQFSGHTAETLPHQGLGELFKTGEPFRLYTSGMKEYWLECRVRELKCQDGNTLTLYYYLDYTAIHLLQQDNERLRRRVGELTITDELTGLANRRALLRILTDQVSRTRRYKNPLSLVLINVLPGEGEPDLSDKTLLSVSHHLRDRLRWADVIGRWTQTEFMLILPETHREAACQVIDNLRAGVRAAAENGPAFRLCFGLSQWEAGCDVKLFIQRAQEAMSSETADSACT